ncbi:group II intron reverse transcriptase/maturase, partial [Bacillus thuringiensis]|uniref:HNH endonuclease n=1 Tax=Bacillus thuringiensis TaxID=1428 RepID=UPI003D01A9B5
KRVATEIRERIGSFLKDYLQLELNMNKTLITHMEDKVRFLGYEITKIKDNTYLTKGRDGIKRRYANGKLALLVPYDVIQAKIQKYAKDGKPADIPARISQTILETLTQYNAEIRGLYNYYCLANNVSARLHWFKYYHYMSLLRTIANKEKMSTTKILKKYGVETKRKDGMGTRKIFGVQYETKKGKQILTYFNHSLVKTRNPKADLSVTIPDKKFMYSSLAERILASECELCGKCSENPKNFEVHHIRRLKDIKNKYKNKNKPTPNWVVTMSAKNRKTLVVCKKCHLDIHGGGYDGKKLTSSE